MAFWVALVAIAAGSLWLRMAFPISALGHSVYDDLLFARLASYIHAAHWLGPYDELTMAKGAAFSVFLALNEASRLPLALSQHLLYLAASLYFAFTMGAVFRSRSAVIVFFALLAVNPLFWNPDIGGRVVRENFYVSLSLLLVAQSVQAFVLERAPTPTGDWRAKRTLLLALGATTGIYWLTREEGVWLLPSILVAAVFGLFRLARSGRGDWRVIWKVIAGFVLVPSAACGLLVGAVNTANYVKYGVFRNNDFRSSDFQAAYGTLARISHAQWRPYVVFPRDAREHAYGASPAARVLRPHLEGVVGERWRKAGCEQTNTDPCPEILSGWFMWALRDAVAAAGYYRSASNAKGYYEDLAREINAACDDGSIPCGRRSDSLVPPWRPEYLQRWMASARAVFGTLFTLGDTMVRVKPSVGDPRSLALFSRVTNEALASRQLCPDDPRRAAGATACIPDRLRLEIAQSLARFQSRASAFALPLALGAWPLCIAVSIIRRRWHLGHVVAAALVAAVASRVALLSFLEATSIPSNNMLYLSPVTPLALALVPCILFLAFAIGRQAQ